MNGRTLDEDLSAAARRQGDKTVLVTQQRSVTFTELDAAAERVAVGLLALGVQPGDRVAIVLPNSVELAEAVYGVMRSCAAITPLNPTIKAGKLSQLLEHASVAAVVCDEERAEVVRAAVARSEREIPIVDDLASIGSRRDGDRPPHPLDSNLGAVVYTSGSTGEPKGVTLTQRNMTFVADSIIEYLEMNERDRILCLLPMSFGYGLYQLLTCVRCGATLVLEQGITFPGRIVGLLESEKITGLPAVPTVFQVLISLKGLAERELPHLRFITNAGAGLPAATLAEVRRTFSGAKLYSMYGQTECQRVCYLPPDQLEVRPTSVGIAIPGTELWVENEEGRVARPGEIGELMVRGSHVMQGYWEEPALTADRLRPGRWPWERVLATGDLFTQDEEGYLYFVGRKDDLIKSRGEKVAPKEVEEVLHSLPGVREAAVIGVPDKLLGQAVQAHVAAHAGHELDPAALKRGCAEQLETHMIPQHVILHTALPRTANGKIDRRSLSGKTPPQD